MTTQILIIIIIETFFMHHFIFEFSAIEFRIFFSDDDSVLSAICRSQYCDFDSLYSAISETVAESQEKELQGVCGWKMCIGLLPPLLQCWRGRRTGPLGGYKSNTEKVGISC